MQVITDSLPTNYQIDGNGKVIVLVHGWADSLVTFKELQKQLGKKYKVITLDLPGFGNTSTPTEVWGLDNYASFVNSFLKKIGENNIYAFIGHSNGGAILIRGISQGILKSEKLILLASAGIRSEDKARKTFLTIGAKVAKVITAPLPKSTKLKLRKKAYGAIGSEIFVAEHLQETFKRVVSADVQSDAALIKIPTLLIYGNKDESTPARYGEKLKNAIPNARLEIIEGVGHFVHHDAQQRVGNLITEFLR
jgi:pimeloyl-ACP methyl ester carboxylesterase